MTTFSQVLSGLFGRGTPAVKQGNPTAPVSIVSGVTSIFHSPTERVHVPLMPSHHLFSSHAGSGAPQPSPKTGGSKLRKAVGPQV